MPSMSSTAVIAGTAHPLVSAFGDDLTARVASALILGALAVAVVIAGSPFFESLVVIAAALMGREWSTLAGVAPGAWPTLILMLAPPLIGIGIAGGVWMESAMFAAAVPVLLLMAFAGRDNTLGIWLAAGFTYVALPVSALIWMRGLDHGLLAVGWVFATVWAADIGAFAVGRTVGGPKLAPRISPNKTWAGLCGGVALAGIAGGAFATWLMPEAHAGVRTLLGVMVGVASQAGDLLESGIKRHFGVKDTGTLIPGHGGVLDRVDGLAVAVPLIGLYEAARLMVPA